MILIEETDVYGFEAAIRGMRNPLESWEYIDSGWYEEIYPWIGSDTTEFVIGRNDLDLMKRLSKAGDDHAKFLRFINVTCDITAPLYWWKEFDTYKVGTVANSCSTMHNIHKKEFTLDDFSHEQLIVASLNSLKRTIKDLNACREGYLSVDIKDPDWKKEIWWQMVQLLPSSYNQKRTVQMNYQVLKNMYHARKEHKLDEWREFCDWALNLPYARELLGVTP